jgi:hypothetical protein
MKRELILLTVLLISSQYAYCQTNKVSESTVSGVSQTSLKATTVTGNLRYLNDDRTQQFLAKTDSKKNGMSPMPMEDIPYRSSAAPAPPSSNAQNINVNEQLIRAQIEALQSNTIALEANTKALQANTKFMQANNANQNDGTNTKVQLPKPQPVAIQTADKTAAASAARTEVSDNQQRAAIATGATNQTSFSYTNSLLSINAVAASASEKARAVADDMDAKSIERNILWENTCIYAPHSMVNSTQPTIHTAATVFTIGNAQLIPVANASVKPTVPAILKVEKQIYVAAALMKPNVPAASPAATLPAKTHITKPIAIAKTRTIPQLPLSASSATTHVIPAITVKPAAKAPQPKLFAAASHPPMAAISTNLHPMTMVDYNVTPKVNRALRLNSLMRLPVLDRSYNSKNGPRHTPLSFKSGLKEGDIITTQGYLHAVATEDSGKKNETYVLRITGSSQWGDSCLIVRLQSSEQKNASRYIRDRFLNGKTPSKTGSVIKNSVLVSVTGELAYDAIPASAMRQPRPVYSGKKGMQSYTPWELSPASQVEFETR